MVHDEKANRSPISCKSFAGEHARALGMSIITKRGDDGDTDAMYGGRLSKNAPGVVACGDVDELNAALGLLRVSQLSEEIIVQIDTIQGHLVALMGLLSVPAKKREKYLAS